MALTGQQDATPGQTYDRVIYLLIAIKAWQVLEGPVFDWLDGRMLGHTLRMSEKRRLKFDQIREETGQQLPGLKRSRPVTIIVACQYVSMVIISWVVSSPRAGGSELTVSCSSSTRCRSGHRGNMYITIVTTSAAGYSFSMCWSAAVVPFTTAAHRSHSS